MDLDDLGNIVALRSTEHVALELASQSADGAPQQFCKLLLPYMLQVMQLTEGSSQMLPIVDRHFSHRYPINGPAHELDDALFTLLSGMGEERLSTTARRRLGELRRRFNMEQPPAPVGFQSIFVGPPIPPEAADHMSDEQWLGAINRYNTDATDLETLRGGAHELSQVLKSQATADPVRFAHLALRLTRQAHPAYSDAILIALADTPEPIDPALVFDVIRHVASLGLDEYQDWLGWPLRRYLNDEIPDDIIEIVLDRALHATSPVEDGWAGHDDGPSAYGGDIFNYGFGSARGQSAIILGDLVIHDATGHRTALVTPSLPRLATDASVAVRSCVAHLLVACSYSASVSGVMRPVVGVAAFLTFRGCLGQAAGRSLPHGPSSARRMACGRGSGSSRGG